MNILFLNPPGTKSFCRDYYCGHETKGRYMWPCTDLVYLSGFFSTDNCLYLDLLKDQRSIADINDEIISFNPEIIISMCSSISWEEDQVYLRRIFEITGAKIFLSGDYAKSEVIKILEDNNFVFGIVTNFLQVNIKEYLQRGERPIGFAIRNIASDKITGELTTPVPNHNLFLKYNYNHPLLRTSRFINFVSDYGCPFKCTFCFFERVQHIFRSDESVLEELNALRDKNIYELFINNPSFGFNKKRTIEFCKLMISVSTRFSWLCQIRADSIDEELLFWMKKAGCHTIQIGVESNNQEAVDSCKKAIPIEVTRNAFKLAKKYKIKTLAYFIIGLDNKDLSGQENLGLFAHSLGADIASFNVASPVINSTFRDDLINQGLLDSDFISGNVSSEIIDWHVDQAYQRRIQEIKAKNERDFYFNISYILKQIFQLRSFYQLKTYFLLGTEVLSKIIFENKSR